MNITKTVLLSVLIGAAVQAGESKSLLDRVKSLNNKYRKDFLHGFYCGMTSSTAINILRLRVLPNLDDLKLHDRTGICRDQLAGQCKVATALVGAALTAPENNSPKHTLVRVLGALIGINTATVASHYITSKLK
jgi:hypothetical protein